MKKRSITATEIKAAVARQCGKIDKSAPYHRNSSIAADQSRTAIAYLTDERYEVTPRTEKAIRQWAAERQNAF
ncbi:hypothetical protein KYT24_004371 [Salmonella enterica]|nr:hypothetical protein [Salmonella enterica]